MKTIVLFISLFSFQIINAQIWTDRTNQYPDERKNVDGFSNGTHGFIMLGTTASDAGYFDCWKYDPRSNTWSQQSDFPGDAKRNTFAFSIDSFAYIGAGTTGSVERSNFYRYNMNSDHWDTLASYPGLGKRNAFSASVGDKAYVGGGYSGTSSRNDFYEYNAATDSWRALPNLPFGARSGGISFSIADTIYFGMGFNGSNDFNDLWAYSINDSTWRQKASLLGIPRAHCNALVLSGKAVVGGGYAIGTSTNLSDYYLYDPAQNQWTSLNGFANDARITAASFTIGNHAYIFGGAPTWTTVDAELWELTLNGNNDSWQQMTTGNPSPRANGVGFSNSTHGFLCLGNNDSGDLKDCWKFDPNNFQWQRVTDFPGVARKNAVGVAIDSIAYVGMGFSNGTLRRDFYSYNTLQDRWDTLANYPGAGRRNPFIGSANGKIYVGGGMSSSSQHNDFYEYNPITDSWRQLSNLPFGNRSTGVYFSIGDTIYFGMGFRGSSSFNDLWAYSAIDSNWTQKPSITGAPRLGSEAFVHFNTAIVGGGFLFGTSTDLADYYEYDQSTGNWRPIIGFSAGQRSTAASFTLSASSYITSGRDNANSRFLNDIWQYTTVLSSLDDRNDAVEEGILIYPNPTKGELLLDVKGDYQFQLFDLSGRRVLNLQLRGRSNLNLQELKNGTYIYSIETNSSVKRGKLVVH